MGTRRTNIIMSKSFLEEVQKRDPQVIAVVQKIEHIKDAIFSSVFYHYAPEPEKEYIISPESISDLANNVNSYCSDIVECVSIENYETALTTANLIVSLLEDMSALQNGSELFELGY